MGNVSQKLLANLRPKYLASLQLPLIMATFWDRPAAFQRDLQKAVICSRDESWACIAWMAPSNFTSTLLPTPDGAREAGQVVPDSVLKKVTEYLDKATSDGIQYGCQSGTEPTLTMTAEALFCRQFLGWQRDDPRLAAGADILLKYVPHYEERDVYHSFFGAQALRQMGGKHWADWGGALREALVKQQEKTGPEKGSWDPKGEHPDRWANLGHGGRLYTTCLSLCALESF